MITVGGGVCVSFHILFNSYLHNDLQSLVSGTTVGIQTKEDQDIIPVPCEKNTNK